MKNNYKVYKHTNIKNGKVYIGITQQSVEKRWQKGYGYKEQVFFYNAIKKNGWNGFLHEILFDNLTEEEAKEKEIQLITQYKSNNRKYGYNLSSGGETYKENFKRRIGKDNVTSKKVNVFDAKTKKFITSYESQNIAAKELGIQRKGINKNCRGISVTYKGYIFEYADIDYQKPIHNGIGNYKHKTTKVCCYNKEGKLLNKFNSIIEAGNFYNIRPNNISCCLVGQSKTSNGMVWKYDYNK